MSALLMVLLARAWGGGAGAALASRAGAVASPCCPAREDFRVGIECSLVCVTVRNLAQIAAGCDCRDRRLSLVPGPRFPVHGWSWLRILSPQATVDLKTVDRE